MKGDFSRQSFNPTKHYTHVLMQQGRVQVDADWNEQQSINQYLREIESTDIVGTSGAPITNPGFAVYVGVNESTFTISSGRYYVEGILCENERAINYRAQPDLPITPNLSYLPTEAQILANPNQRWLVYLDVWKQHITALDDPLIREPALGGADTASRVKTVWQVKFLPILSTVNPDCKSNLPEWDNLIAPSKGTLNVRTQPPQPEDNPCLIPPSAGYQRLENQLYRVEIHKNDPGKVTFKWSRDNGTVETIIEKINGLELTVRDLGRDEILGFASEQWVEVTDESQRLQGLPGQLVQIATVNPASRIITLKATTPLNLVNFNPSLRPKLRRWDQTGATATIDGVSISTSWLALEGGIQVQFSNDTYKTGDYWLIPARAATGEVEWPPYAVPNLNPLPQLPQGIRHAYSRLAIAGVSNGQLQVFSDCRRLFNSLPEFVNAFHVTETNWTHDDGFSLERLLAEGLKITLDAFPATESISSATVIVRLESTTSDFSLSYLLKPSSLLAQGNQIQWRVSQATLSQLAAANFAIANARLRITLKGSAIYSRQYQIQQLYYLDGQAYGKPGGQRTGSQEPRMALTFPSGSGNKASDFESWLYIGQPLQVRYLTFLSVNLNTGLSKVSSAGTVTLPRINQPLVRFLTTENVNTIDITFSRSVLAEGLDTGEFKALLLQFGTLPPLTGSIVRLNDQTVRFISNTVFNSAGNYTLILFGTQQERRGLVKAVDDNSSLDGDFSGQSGGDFSLVFTAVRPSSYPSGAGAVGGALL